MQTSLMGETEIGTEIEEQNGRGNEREPMDLNQ